MVHGDLSSSNVLAANKDGESSVKLCDFGPATIFDSQFGMQWQRQSMLGTLQYMAPERPCGAGAVRRLVSRLPHC